MQSHATKIYFKKKTIKIIKKKRNKTNDIISSSIRRHFIENYKRK